MLGVLLAIVCVAAGWQNNGPLRFRPFAWLAAISFFGSARQLYISGVNLQTIGEIAYPDGVYEPDWPLLMVTSVLVFSFYAGLYFASFLTARFHRTWFAMFRPPAFETDPTIERLPPRRDV